MKNMIHILISR